MRQRSLVAWLLRVFAVVLALALMVLCLWLSIGAARCAPGNSRIMIGKMVVAGCVN